MWYIFGVVITILLWNYQGVHHKVNEMALISIIVMVLWTAYLIISAVGLSGLILFAIGVLIL